jgi:hypothetical protein
MARKNDDYYLIQRPGLPEGLGLKNAGEKLQFCRAHATREVNRGKAGLVRIDDLNPVWVFYGVLPGLPVEVLDGGYLCLHVAGQDIDPVILGKVTPQVL